MNIRMCILGGLAALQLVACAEPGSFESSELDTSSQALAQEDAAAIDALFAEMANDDTLPASLADSVATWEAMGDVERYSVLSTAEGGSEVLATPAVAFTARIAYRAYKAYRRGRGGRVREIDGVDDSALDPAEGEPYDAEDDEVEALDYAY